VELGGVMLIHDSFSSVGVTAAIATELLTTRHFRFAGRSGSLAEYRGEELDTGARIANAARQLAEVPYFVRNLLVKVLMVLRLRPLTRLLGNRTGEWPY